LSASLQINLIVLIRWLRQLFHLENLMRPIFDMSRTEKLRVMEALWEDLSHGEDDLLSPAWHQTALTQTEQATAAGNVHFMDWEQAKKLLCDASACAAGGVKLDTWIVRSARMVERELAP
jgi:Putative addiction module component